jgi:hypothetical protein
MTISVSSSSHSSSNFWLRSAEYGNQGNGPTCARVFVQG